jgi:hypothetical protein
MKRIIIIIGAILLGFAARAQSVTYTCRYWFDQNYAQAVTSTFSESTWQMELDVGSLNEGLHSLHLHVMDTSMKWSAPQSYLFFKADVWESGTPNYVCHCWFDEDFANEQSNDLGNGHLLLDVADLEEGMHTVHVLVEGTQLAATQSYLFMRAGTFTADTLDMSHLAYHCWFDQDFEHQQIDSLGDGHLLLDVNALEDGLHTVHVMLQGSTYTATQSYVFMKMPVENPSTELQYICWFDQDYGNAQTGSLGSGLFELQVGNLSNGIHAVNVQLTNGSLTAPQTYLFYKQPLGGYGIARWEYWLNDDIGNRTTTNFSPSIDSLDIISLLPVGHPAIRSSCFHFHPDGDAPYINAKNQINFRFWDAENRVIDKSAFFVDEQVQQDIVAQVFERNTTETFAAPRNNQIQWFKVEAGIGDSLAFMADKACSMQLFAPSGEEVYAATASEAMVFGGCHAWEDGTYYLAVHDQTGSGETLSVTYQYINKYAVLAYDVHLVGNGGRSTITFQGNGFNSLLDVYLVNEQNDTIQPLDIGHESNTTTTVTFNFYGVNLGVYDAVFQFVDDVIQIQNAIQVEEATPFVFDASVTFAARFLRTTSNKYVFQVHNYSNMTAYNVPLLVHIYTPDAESLTRVDIEGFDVKSDIIQLLGSHYTDSIDNLIEQKRLISGDLFGFLEEPNTEYVPDAPYLHYIFITPTLRPNTTEIFTIAVKSTNTVTVYMWYPEEWENEDSIGKSSRTKGTMCSLAEERRERCAANQRAAEWDEIIPYPGERCDNLPKPNPNCPPPPGGHSTPVNSLDPNDIHGYLSESGSHYMRQEIQNIYYEIEFENDTTLATAAAHTIIVRDTLDAAKFDLNSLAAHSVTIGDKRLDLNGEQNFALTLDMRPELYVIAQINQDYDPATGIVEWTIQSLDPMTMEPTDNPYQGVLPVNYYGNGIGFIDYSINLKQTFDDGTEVSNRAGIIFDQEDIIMTPTWTNIVDAVKPTSYIQNVVPVDDSLSFSFVSSDNRSGVWYHSLYYRNESTELEWKVKVPKIVENNYLLHFDEYQTTEYLVMSVDSAGNVEDKDMVAEYVHYYDGPEPLCQSMDFSKGWNWFSTYIEVDSPITMLQMVEAALGENGVAIKSSDVYTEYDAEWDEWLGDLDEEGMVNEQMYKILVSGPCTLSVGGTPANPADHPITIVQGWNWIGFPSAVAMSLDDAFAGFAQEGDVIRNSDGETPYDPEWGGWFGDFDTLEPGQGYMYFSTSNTPRTLIFPAGAK